MIENNYHYSTYRTRMGVAILHLIRLTINIMNVYIGSGRQRNVVEQRK